MSVQTFTGVNNYTNLSGTRNSIEDYSVPFRTIFNSQGVLIDPIINQRGLIITPTSPASPAINISTGYALIDCGGAEFLIYRLKTAITNLVVPDTGGVAKNYLICLRVDLINATDTIVVVEGTTNQDPNLPLVSDNNRTYYLPIGRITKNTTVNVTTSEILQDGFSLTNNTTPVVIYQNASLLNGSGAGGSSSNDPLLLTHKTNYQWLTQWNTNDINSTTLPYFARGNNFEDNRNQAVYRLTQTGQYVDHQYGPIGQICPQPTHTGIHPNSTAGLYMYANPTGISFQWSNRPGSGGLGGGTDYWYDVIPGDIIYNLTRSNYATILTFGLNTGTVTNAPDISTWQIHDQLAVYSGDLSGKIKNMSGFSNIFDLNAYYQFTMRGQNTTDNLKYQVEGRSWVIFGKKGPSQGSFDLYVDGVFIQNVSTSNGSILYAQNLYQFIPTPDAPTTNELYVHKNHIVEIKPHGDGLIEIEYFWLRNTRFSLDFHTSTVMEYFPALIPTAIALGDNKMLMDAFAGTINMINMNQLTSNTAGDQYTWCDYNSLWAKRTSIGYDGYGAFEESSWSTDPTYATYTGQPTQTRTGFVGLNLLVAYQSGKSKMTSTQRNTIQQSILNAASAMDELLLAWHTYTTNAALFIGLLYIGAYYVQQDLQITQNQSTLSAAITTTTGLTFTVTDPTQFKVGKLIQIDSEIMGISTISGNTITVISRGWMGTTPTTHLIIAPVTVQGYDVEARSVIYSMRYGEPGVYVGGILTIDPYFKYTVGNGSNEGYDEGWGDELPSQTTTTATFLSTDTQITMVNIALANITPLLINVFYRTALTLFSGGASIQWQTANTIRYYFPIATSLAGVVAGDVLVCTTASSSRNNGSFIITNVNTGSHYLDVTNPGSSTSGGDETSSPAIINIGNGINFYANSDLGTTPRGLELQVAKNDGSSTWELIEANNFNFVTNVASGLLRAQSGSTSASSIASGAIVKNGHSWAYGRIIPGLIAAYYYFAKKLLWSEAPALRGIAKAHFNLERRRNNYNLGTVDCAGGSRLPYGGAEFSGMGGVLEILSAMGEGWRGDDQFQLRKWVFDEMSTYGFTADGTRDPVSGNANAGNDLSAPGSLFVNAIPNMIKLLG